MADKQGLRDCRGLLRCFTFLFLWEAVAGQIHYSIPEEMQKGFFVGNIAKDLGLDTKTLLNGGVRIIAEGRTKYFALNLQNGYLYISEKVDREEICGRISKCLLQLEIFIQEEVKLYTVEIEITDINDNAPSFQVEELELKISEITSTGSRFLLPDAQDPDIGSNSIRSFQFSSNRHFSLDVQMGADGAKYAELVLQKILDREEQAVYNLVLTAIDGGDPVRSGTARIRVIVEDANDNAPVFTQSVYKVNVLENVSIGSLLVTVNATDLDEGMNSEVTYSFRKISAKASDIFHLDSKTGKVTVTGHLDFEESDLYEIEVQARDGRGLSARTRVSLVLTDVNDNAPEITITSLITSIPEDSPEGTVIAFLNVRDADSRENGEVTCSIPGNLPCRLQKLFDNYYSLVTDRALDREQVSDYNVTIIATDRGTPALSTTTFFLLKVLDKNDNPPVFRQTLYTSYITENNPKGAPIFALKANDADWEENARVTYSVAEGQIQGTPLSSYISINSETGALYALRSFDYEQFREIRFQVQAQDGGSPPLSSNVSVTLLILDQNDNSPHILHPSFPTDGSTGVELAPRSSEPGYLVTKVVAVDADSGQNAWLSYQLLKATEPGLFSVGLHSGEIRTARYFVDRDALKQSLVVLVKDNGQPPLSATATVTVMVADSIPEILSDLSSFSAPVDPQSSLTLYLVIAVASVSCLFFSFIIVLLALRLRRRRNSQLFDSSSVILGGVPVSQFVGIDGVTAFLHSYSHEVSLTTDSRKSQLAFPNGSCSNTLTGQQPSEKSGPFLVAEVSNIHADDQVSLQLRYAIPEEMAKGSLVGTLAKDLGLNVRELSSRSLRIVASSKRQYFAIEIQDINDNLPYFTRSNIDFKISESALPGARFPLEIAQDPDVGINTVQNYQLSQNQYFILSVKESTNGNKYAELVLGKHLDREKQSSHHLMFKALHGGDPLRTGTLQIRIIVTDTNDNPPVFTEEIYKVSLIENLPQGFLVLKVKAMDKDEGLHAKIVYSFSNIPDSISKLFKMDPDNREIITKWSLDYETANNFLLDVEVTDGGGLTAHCKLQREILDENDNAPEITLTSVSSLAPENSLAGTFEMQVKAQDGGSLALSSNVTIRVFILDQNDNAPCILYPSLGANSSALYEMVPRSAEAGYLVTKVVAVDADSGHNAWLSYHLLQAMEPVLFSMGLHTGEIQTARAFADRDAVKHRLVTLGKDNGQPPLSATVFFNLVFAENFQEALPEMSDQSGDSASQSDLQFYLVLALASTSFLFLLTVTLAIVMKLRRSGKPSVLRPTSTCDKGLNFLNTDGQNDTPGNILCSNNSGMLYLSSNSNDPNSQPETLPKAVSGQIRCTIPEEMQKGSFVGNIAKDLGLDIKALSNRGVRIVGRGRTQYFTLNVSGRLYPTGRIDREQISGQMQMCLINFEIIVEDKMKVFGVEVEITDINDNAPRFQEDELEFKTSELAAVGTRYSLEGAQDPDVGINSVQGYYLSSNKHFSLDVQTGADGKYAELVLEKSLDREEQAVHDLILTATDGGDPVRSGTAQIRVIVLDANDNAPVFSQPVYKVSVLENVPVGSLLPTVNATDPDEGINSEVTYSLRKMKDKASQIFQVDSKTGEISTVGNLDYEESASYEMEVQAKDVGDLSARSKVLIAVININDNAPEITVTNAIKLVSEDSPPGTVIALINVHDRDSGENGEVTCSIPRNIPFWLQKSFDNYYSSVTDRPLDRKQVLDYNVTVTATDRGTPPLSSTATILVQLSDINDNAPVFNQTSYTLYITKNNPRGTSICSMKANDRDWRENARVTYSIIEYQRGSPVSLDLSEVPLSSSISINSETGALYALRSFDYEQFREIRFQVQAQDGGSPPLSSNVSVTLFILDQNDNSPQILHPSFPTDGSTGVELAPRSSEPGYLVTKVVAVDADSGQNAWLSYQLLKATEPGLFSVGLHSGEIRTARYFVDHDALKQSLVVLVKDNGQPPLSATATVTVVVADNIPEILSDLSSLSAPADPKSSLTLYLVIALASVSCLFFTFIIVLLALRRRSWRNSQLFDSSSVTFSGVPISQFVGIDGVRTFLHSGSHEVSLTTDSRKSQCIQSELNYSNGPIDEEKEGLLIAEHLRNNEGNDAFGQINKAAAATKLSSQFRRTLRGPNTGVARPP
ncbi:LOW QUALITY PROTEIN: uncharacterized protein RBU57_009892 [Macrochelys suwanniensis]